MSEEPEHDIEITKTEGEEGYQATCICGWSKEEIPKRPLARAISERHLLLNKKWPYEDEEQHPDWLT
jgi:hypothetical protein